MALHRVSGKLLGRCVYSTLHANQLHAGQVQAVSKRASADRTPIRYNADGEAVGRFKRGSHLSILTCRKRRSDREDGDL
jgi:hypothetical protein